MTSGHVSDVKYGGDSGGFYVLVEPTYTQVLVVICDHGVEEDAMFSTEDRDC